MPTGRYYGAALKKALESGEVPMVRLDDMVRRILRTGFALGIYDNPPVMRPVTCLRGRKWRSGSRNEGWFC